MGQLSVTIHTNTHNLHNVATNNMLNGFFLDLKVNAVYECCFCFLAQETAFPDTNGLILKLVPVTGFFM